ncbi:MAG: quinone-dependent dihydroorotate dehydrogenase [Steroidobacteraceae bacterium]
MAAMSLYTSIAGALFDCARPLLHRIDPETSHGLSLHALNLLQSLRCGVSQPELGRPVRCLGLQFANPLGLAAGCDKNADYIDALGALGFGHVEVGTVTPRPQSGNPRPRLFRIRSQRAVVNRMGFNNKGIDHLVARLQQRRFRGICGVNIGKNAATPLEHAQDDYLISFRKAYAVADYFVVNISSPNTARLRELQSEDGLERIANALLGARVQLSAAQGRSVPVLVKIAPDLQDDEIELVAAAIQRAGFDGIVATNTTTRLDLLGAALPEGAAGGLSGAPLRPRSLQVIRQLRAAVGSEFPIIGVGGISSGTEAVETLRAGATLIQMYTGFVYRGPALVSEILAATRSAG